MTHTEKRLGIVELLRFFVPLAITWMLMMFTHNIISGGLSRTLNPTVSTAAYAVALSLAAIAEAPLVMMRQVTLAFVQSEQTFSAVGKVLLCTLGFFMAVVVSIGYIPAIGRFVFQGLLGVSDSLLAPTILAFRVTMFMPVTSGLRCIYQGVIMVRRRTTYISTGMFIRVGFMVFLIFGFTRYRWVTGPLVGALTLVGGIAVEGIMAFFFGRRIIPRGEAQVDLRTVWRFYLPLVASSLMVSMGRPFINAGLARLPDATVALAAYSVASSFAWVIIAPSQNVHQVAMVFGRNPLDRPLVRKFAVAFALFSATLLAAISFSPVGPWILQNLISVPPEILNPTLAVVRTLSFFPLIMCWLEYNTGILLLSQSTRLVSLSKTVNLFATIAFVTFFARLLPGSVAAPLAQMIGFACEGVVLQLGRTYLPAPVTPKRATS